MTINLITGLAEEYFESKAKNVLNMKSWSKQCLDTGHLETYSQARQFTTAVDMLSSAWPPYNTKNPLDCKVLSAEISLKCPN